ncbi:MAG TPA: AraC family transcriptional regulator [Lachnospiraceae bacterium]|nr:AraC family transcriptional regulator [Lachnospiraceae bacterium]
MYILQKLNSLTSASDTFYIDKKEACSDSHAVFFLVLKDSVTFSGTSATSGTQMKNISVKCGELFFLPPYASVQMVPEGMPAFFVLRLHPLSLLDLLDEGQIIRNAHLFSRNHAVTEFFIRYAASCLSEGTSSEIRNAEEILPFIYELNRFEQSSSPAYQNDSPGLKQGLIFNNVLAYIQTNFCGNLSLNQISENFHVTPQYFANFFKKNTGLTYHQYIQELRCRKGSLYVDYASLTPVQAAEKVNLKDAELLTCGRGNNTDAPSLKKNENNSQGSFRPIARERALFLLTELADRKGSDIETEERHKEQAAIKEIHINAEKANDYHPLWNELINLGYATEFHASSLYEQIVRAKKELGFRYARICRLMDLIVRTSESDNQYDYTSVFLILDFMAENHILPFIELGNKLFRIQLSGLQDIPKNEARNFDAYLKNIVSMMPAFIRACINRYGAKNFSKWRFEFSFSPDDFREAAEDVTFFKYVQCLRQLKDILYKYSPDTKLGAPGFNRWDMPERLLYLLDTCAQNHALPDFVTIYFYPVYRTDGLLSISSDPDLLEKQLRKISGIIQNKYPGMEIWITEFNSNLSSRSFINDSIYQGSYLIRNMTESLNCGASAIAYYQLSDIPLRYSDNLDFLFGGWGLITDTGIPKPSWHAMHLLALSGKQLLYQQKGIFITCSSRHQFQCLFYHYEHIRPEISRRNIAYREFEFPEALFLPSDPESLTVEIENAQPGTYLVKELNLTASSGSILNEWRKTGYLSFSGRHEIGALEKSSDLIPVLSAVTVKEGEPMRLFVRLRHHDIRMFLIDLVKDL